MNDLLKENKIGIAIAMAFIIIGTVYYSSAGLGTTMGPTTELSKETTAVLRGAELKVGVAEERFLKLFALAPNSALASLDATDGSPIPKENAIVIGALEAKMMQEEKLFEKPGDALTGFFGIDTTIGGVLTPTGTIIDDTHFLSGTEFRQLDAQEDRVFVEFAPDGLPKVFYRRDLDETMPVPLVFAQGSDTEYKMHDLAGTNYYPVIIGSAEAAMMREEKLFDKPGDIIKGFFGNDIVIVGVLAKTGTALDMMHITPLGQERLA